MDEHYRYNYTRIPPTIAKLHRQCFETAAKIGVWLNQLGCETSHDFYLKDGIKAYTERLLEQTNFTIEVSHTNDYVDCGPGYDDKHGQMFYIETPISFSVTLLASRMEFVFKQFSKFAQHELEINKELHHVYLDFYSHNKKDFHPEDMSACKLTGKLKFKIRHSWGSLHNDDEPTGDDMRAAYAVGEHEIADKFSKKIVDRLAKREAKHAKT